MSSRPEIILIAALCKANRVIGNQGAIPWHLPEDLRRFRELTTGHTLIMGRKTWEESLNGRSLPNRRSIIVSRTLPPTAHAFEADQRTSRCVVSSLDEAFHPDVVPSVSYPEKIFVIGGASIYAQTLAMADRLELTLVDGVYEGDAVFPEYEPIVRDTFCLIHEGHYDGFQTQTYKAMRSG
jgi:dihydrofolate reductase